MPNNYYPFSSSWSLKEWQDYCPDLQYRVVSQDQFPSFLPGSLTCKFNCAMVASSGSLTNQTYVFQGYRVDGTKIDEHQYVVTYDRTTNKSYAGFIEHADYSGRTTDVPFEMQQSISLSGIAIDFQFPRKPPALSGRLSDLIAADLIRGFTHSVDVQNRNRPV